MKIKTDFLFVLPSILIVVGLLGFSMAFLGETSLQKVGITFINPENVGLANYTKLLGDSNFWYSFGNTFLFAFAKVLAFLTIGFLLAFGLTYVFRGVKVVNAILFAPTLVPMALLALVFQNVFANNGGTINSFLTMIGLGDYTVNWLGMPGTAKVSIIILSCYLVGLAIMYYTADFMTIDPELFDSAIVDGANTWHIMTKIVFPLAVNSHKTIIISCIVGGIRAFGEVYMLTGGGPGKTTEIVSTYIYKYIISGASQIGYSSAMSLVVMAIALVLSVIQIKILYSKEA